MVRLDNRAPGALRPVRFDFDVQRNPLASVGVRFGQTFVMVAVSIEDRVPDFLDGKGRGWLSAEYAMHPCANPRRQARDGRKGRIDGRTQEIQRLIGRSLRAVVDFHTLGERTLSVDCDVIDADGGTRTASITGGFVALALALYRLRQRSVDFRPRLRDGLAAVSVGRVDGSALLDLCYQEDHRAEMDLNVAATHDGALVELQGTAEGAAIPRPELNSLVDLAIEGIAVLRQQQRDALEAQGVNLDDLLRS